MKVIIITSPDFIPSEAGIITTLLNAGLEYLHLRKPEATKEDYESLLSSIPVKHHEKIMLHDHFELVEKYNVRGVHLNRRNPEYTGTKNIKISRSCHSLKELEKLSEFEYVFLSPILNSISKKEYKSTFTDKELSQASDNGLINEKVIALGGIDALTLPLIQKYPFGGIALLGAIWNGNPLHNYKTIINKFKK